MRETPFWRRYLRLTGSDPAADVQDEIDFHFQMRVSDLMRAGMDEGDARERAQREFGNADAVLHELKAIGRDRQRHEQRVRSWDAFVQDLRFAARTLSKNPGFTLVAVLTLALGIGASTAMFTLVNTVLLRPLDLPESDRLVVVWERPQETGRDNSTSPANYSAWTEQARSFSGLAAFVTAPVNVTGDGDAAQVLGQGTSDNYFSVLNLRPQLGRTYVPGQSAETYVVLSDELWRSRYGGDPGVIGRSITVGRSSRTVIGVMPRNFRLMGIKAALWIPVTIDPQWTGRYLTVIGRLRSGATLEQANAEMGAIAARMAEADPRQEGWGAEVVGLHEQTTGDVRPALLVLLGAVGLLLLIACTNVANLLLARAASRRREIAVRLSLGSTRARLVRQMLTEGVLLSALAGMLGFAIAVWGTHALEQVVPPDLALPRMDEIGVDGRVLAFAIGVSLLTGILFGVAPALSGSRVQLAGTLREATRGTTGARSRLRSGLVVGEVALAVVLLVGAGLLGRSLQRLLAVDTGIQTDGVLTMLLSMSGAEYEEAAARRTFISEVMQRVAAMPSVEAAAAEVYLPLTGLKIGHAFWREDRPRPAPGDESPTDIRVIAGDYFSALRIPLLHGRAFDSRDSETGAPVGIVNEEFARRYFPGEDPIGRRIGYEWDDDEILEIVGVVGDVRELGPTAEPSPALYRPYAQFPMSRLSLLVRTARAPLSLSAPITGAVRELNPNQPVADVKTMDQLAAGTVARTRLTLYLLGGFAAMALLLAALGLYGLIAYSVVQRQHEIGVRLALGAGRGKVLAMVIRHGLSLTVVGLGIGILAAIVSTRSMASMLFGIAPTDPITLAGIAAFLGAIAVFASWIPAVRATRVDPVIAMRAE
jgi:putative ABC transport system permease protein